MTSTLRITGGNQAFLVVTPPMGPKIVYDRRWWVATDLSVVVTAAGECEYLIVSGGGAGGNGPGAGGGGGGGALLKHVLQADGTAEPGNTDTDPASLATGTYFFTVGAGGSASGLNPGQGGNGGASSILLPPSTVVLVASRGGGGGSGLPAAGSGGDTNGQGGGGGGASATASAGGAAGSSGGFAGGDGIQTSGVAGINPPSPAPGGGGGGGASAAGGDAGGAFSGVGGDGLASSISGSSVTYAPGGGGGGATGMSGGLGGNFGLGGTGGTNSAGAAGIAIGSGGGGGGGTNNGAAGTGGRVELRWSVPVAVEPDSAEITADGRLRVVWPHPVSAGDPNAVELYIVSDEVVVPVQATALLSGNGTSTHTYSLPVEITPQDDNITLDYETTGDTLESDYDGGVPMYAFTDFPVTNNVQEDLGDVPSPVPSDDWRHRMYGRNIQNLRSRLIPVTGRIARAASIESPAFYDWATVRDAVRAESDGWVLLGGANALELRGFGVADGTGSFQITGHEIVLDNDRNAAALHSVVLASGTYTTGAIPAGEFVAAENVLDTDLGLEFTVSVSDAQAVELIEGTLDLLRINARRYSLIRVQLSPAGNPAAIMLGRWYYPPAV